MEQSCSILKISRVAFYKWSTGELSPRRAENERIADLVEDIHEKHPEMGTAGSKMNWIGATILM